MLEINDDNFDESTKEGLVLVDFYANWCGPCRALAPLLEEIKGVKIVKVDVDKNPTLSEKYNVSAIPKLILFKNGDAVHTTNGIPDMLNLQEVINNASNQ